MREFRDQKDCLRTSCGCKVVFDLVCNLGCEGAAGAIYVFKNGVDRSDAQPWGGGPFGYQIDILDSVPDDQAYTPLRNPHIVTWTEDADPRVLTSVEELMTACSSGKLEITTTDVVVTAPIVSWPGDLFEESPKANGTSESMEQMSNMMDQMSE